MLKLFKKKTPVYIDLENYDYSSFARDMTEEELLTVNGGKEIANTNEAVAGAEVGDTLTRNDGTTVVITQGDIDWAQGQIGSPGTSSSTTSTESTSSTSNTNSESTSDRPKDQNNASSTVNMGAGNMTVTDYIAQQRKKGAGATVPGQSVEGKKPEGQAAVENTAGEGNLTERGYPSSRDPNPGNYKPKQEAAPIVDKNSNATVDPRNRGFTLTTDNYPDAYKTKEKTADEKVKEAVAKIGKKDYIVGEYQCDQYVNEIVEKAGYDPKDFYLDDPSGKTVDKHISDLIASGKSYSTSASSLLPGSYVVFMSDDDKVKNSHAALLVVENGSAYIQDNSSHNNATAWNEYGKAIAWAGGTEKTLDISAKAVCNQFTGYENFYFQRII